MIKQTSGAISFLLAAYRAILKKNFLLALIAAASFSASGNALAAYTLDQDKTFEANNTGIDKGDSNGLTRDDDAVIKSGVTLKITTNAKLDTNSVKNEGNIILTNCSVLDGSVIQNMCWGSLKMIEKISAR